MNQIEYYQTVRAALRLFNSGVVEPVILETEERLKGAYIDRNIDMLFGIMTEGERRKYAGPDASYSAYRYKYWHPMAYWLKSFRGIVDMTYSAESQQYIIDFLHWEGDEGDSLTVEFPKHLVEYVGELTPEHDATVRQWFLDEQTKYIASIEERVAGEDASRKARELESALAVLKKHGVNITPADQKENT